MMGDLSRAFGADASNFNAEASQNKRHQNKFGSGSGNIQRSGHYEPKDGHAFFAATSAPFAVAMDSPPKPNPEVEELKKQLQQRDQAIAGLQQQLMAARGLHAKAQEYKRRAHAAEVSLNQALASHNTPSASRSTSKVHKEVKISPTMFSITNNGVKRNELSRCASMGTRSSLEAAALGSQHDRIAERIIMVRRQLCPVDCLVTFRHLSSATICVGGRQSRKVHRLLQFNQVRAGSLVSSESPGCISPLSSRPLNRGLCCS